MSSHSVGAPECQQHVATIIMVNCAARMTTLMYVEDDELLGAQWEAMGARKVGQF